MTLNTAQARSAQNQTYDYSYNILTRNSTLSNQVDRICNFFEGGDGARLISDEITEFIANLEVTSGITINNNSNNKKTLLEMKSLKDKIAFYISLCLGGSPGVSVIPSKNIIDKIVISLDSIENHITENIDISQKFTIRHAAMNRFNVKLKRDESLKLDDIINKLEVLIKKANLGNYTFHFGQIKDTQKIKKIEEALRMVNRANISSDDKKELIELTKDFGPLSDKLKPLDELDESYENMSTALNNMYTLNRGSMQVLSKSARVFRSADIRRLTIALSFIEGKDRKTFNIEDYTKGLFKDGKISDLNIELEKILTDSKIKEALKKANMTEEYFTRAYLEHFSQELVIAAKQRLDSKKRTVFGVNKKDFEQDINNWKENQRQRIINIGGDIQARGGLANPDEIFILTSYLRKNKHVFVEGIEGNQDIQNRNLRVALEVAIANITPNSLDNERDILRDTVLTQNRNVNDLFYGDNNAFDAKTSTDRPMHNVLNHIRRITEMTSVFSQKYGQAISKTILVGGGAMLASSIGFGTILAGAGLAVGAKYLGKGLDKSLTPYHAWLAKERKGFARLGVFPLKIAKIITGPLEKLGYGIDAGSDKIISIAKNTRTKVNDAIANKIGSKEFIKNLTDSKVNNLFSASALLINGTFRGVSELTTLGSNVGLDLMDTSEKRRILEGIYSTQNAQNLRELAEQVEIQSIIQEDVGLYEKDGYVDVIQPSKEESRDKKVNSLIKYYNDELSEKLKEKAEGLNSTISSRKEELDGMKTDNPNKDIFNSIYTDNKRILEKANKKIGKLSGLFSQDISKMDNNKLGKHFEKITSTIKEIYTLFNNEFKKNDDRIKILGKSGDIASNLVDASLIAIKRQEIKDLNDKLTNISSNTVPQGKNSGIQKSGNLTDLIKEAKHELNMLLFERQKLNEINSEMKSFRKIFNSSNIIDNYITSFSDSGSDNENLQKNGKILIKNFSE